MAGKRDELRLPGHLGEPPRRPIRLRLLDLLARAGDEVPPDVPRTVHRRAAQKEDPGFAFRPAGNPFPGPRVTELSAGKLLAPGANGPVPAKHAGPLVAGGPPH